jgi:hypothetical protein
VQGWPLVALLHLCACGPTTSPPAVECDTADVRTEAEILIGRDGPSCDVCPADADLIIATTLSTECGLVEWRTPSTCLVSSISATRESDGRTYTSPIRYCGDAFVDWSVAPGEPLVSRELYVSDVFGGAPIPAGTYEFEVELFGLLSIEPATFEATVE